MNEVPTKKVVVIAGGNGYLGGALVQVFLDHEFAVVVLGRKEALQKRESVWQKSVDITNAEAVREAARAVQETHGKVYAVIHCASAPLVRKSIQDLSDAEFEDQFSVGVTGAFHLFSSFSGILCPNGALIGITSRYADDGLPHPKLGSYIPSKLALRGLLRVLSDELKDVPLRVYAVAPAFMPGGLSDDLPQVVKDFFQHKSKPEDITSPEAVSATVLTLVNDEGRRWSGKSISSPGDEAINL